MTKMTVKTTYLSKNNESFKINLFYSHNNLIFMVFFLFLHTDMTNKLIELNNLIQLLRQQQQLHLDLQVELELGPG